MEPPSHFDFGSTSFVFLRNPRLPCHHAEAPSKGNGEANRRKPQHHIHRSQQLKPPTCTSFHRMRVEDG